MENMVTDKSIEYVLMFCDRTYMEKADGRQGGVGTEATIISQELYGKADAEKFIPIACERTESGDFTLPVFAKKRNAVDFSTVERAHENWEELIRIIYKKPRHKKPAIGSPPAYISNNTTQTHPGITFAFTDYQDSIRKNSADRIPALNRFLDACVAAIDTTRVRFPINSENIADVILEKYDTLKIIQKQVLTWILFEPGFSEPNIQTILLAFLERILEAKSPSIEMQTWDDRWFEGHALFLHELFTYIIGAMLKTGNFQATNNILRYRYMLPETLIKCNNPFGDFSIFFGGSVCLKQKMTPGNGRYYLSPKSKLFMDHADMEQLPFDPVFLESELVLFFASFINKSSKLWFPWSLVYTNRLRAFPLFLKAERPEDCDNLGKLFGISDLGILKDTLREAIKMSERTTSSDTCGVIRMLPICANIENNEIQGHATR